MRKLFCRHEWDTVSEGFFKSNLERLLEKGHGNFSYLPSDLQGTHIVIVKCDKCGAVKKFVTKT